jgi:hypothetical protein
MSQLKSMMKADAGKAAAGSAAGKDQHIREAIEVRARSPPRRRSRGVQQLSWGDIRLHQISHHTQWLFF